MFAKGRERIGRRDRDVQQRQDPGAPDGKHVGGQAEEG